VGSRQAVAALAVVALAGCGGKSALKPSGCVRVFFNARAQGTATAAQIRAVGDRPESFRHKLVSYRFISRRQALARMRRRYPYLVHRMPFNPFPAAFEATPGSVDYGRELVDALTPRPPGVHAVRYSRTQRRC
jgi:cell division protein FtsX